MRRNPIPLLCGLLVVGTAVAVGRNVMVPRVRTATRAEILAALPASLRVADAPDPAGEARYARLVTFADRAFRTAEVAQSPLRGAKTASEREKIASARLDVADAASPLEGLLDEGGWRVPARKAGALLPEDTKFRALGKAIAACADDAARRGDRAECARLVVLDLRFGQALTAGKGVLIDELVGIAVEGVADRAAVAAEMAGGLDAAGRQAVLAAMPPLAGPMPELGDALRREFQSSMLPILAGGPADIQKAYADQGVKAALPQGTWDGVATARFLGRIDEAEIGDTRVAYRRQGHEGERIAEEVRRDLPSEPSSDEVPDGIEGVWLRFKYRLAMNAQANTIGRGLVSEMTYSLGNTAAHRAAARNLARATILLHAGQPASVADPYGDGPLRVDAKRRVVWSVGQNGRDDGGQIGKGGAGEEPDYGYSYDPGVWKALAARS